MVALTAEFYRIMKDTSDKPDLKKELQEKGSKRYCLLPVVEFVKGYEL